MPSCLLPTFPLVALFLMGDVVRVLRDMLECLLDLDGVEGGQGILLSPVREITELRPLTKPFIVQVPLVCDSHIPSTKL